MITFNFLLTPPHHDALDEADLPHTERWEGNREGHTPSGCTSCRWQMDSLFGRYGHIIVQLKETT